MSSPIEVVRIGHAIHVAENLAQLRELYMNVLGAIIFAGGYGEAEDRDMHLIYVANYMLEPMSPSCNDNSKPIARYLDRYGAGYQSVELEIKDCPSAEQHCKEMGIATRNPAQSPVYFFPHPKSTAGLLFEMCGVKMPNDPYDYEGWNPDWIKGHPSSLERLSCMNYAVSDMAGAKRVMTEMVNGKVLHEDTVAQPEAMDRCFIGIAGEVFSLCAPHNENAGPVSRYISQRTPGLYSISWKVGSLDKAKAHFEAKGVRHIEDGCVTGEIAIHPDDFLGARHEFTTRKQPYA